MNILTIQHLQKFFGTEPVLRDVHFSVTQGEKIGLVGRNGAGKTTLFRILTGQSEYDSGQVRFAPGIRRGYLEQDAMTHPEQTLLEYCQEVFQDLMNREEALKSFENQISETSHEAESFEALLNQYHEAVEQFELLGGYTFRNRIRGVLKGLGFSPEEVESSASNLSGGQLTRLSIARLLLTEPDLLLLDEPTNHLDIAAVQWLELYLKQYSGTLILITHDRFFLDQVTDRIIEIERGQTVSYQGNYSKFQEYKRKNREVMEKAFEKQEAEVARQEEIIRRFKQHGTEKLAKRAQSREKHLSQMVRMEAPEAEEGKLRFQFSVSAPSGRDVLTAEDLSFGYGDTPLFSNIHFNLYRGERVGLIGANGIGKTTLFKLIQNQLNPSGGRIIQGHNVKPGVYDQKLTFDDERRNLLEELSTLRPDLSDTRHRILLGSFLFTGDEVFKPIAVLSGGERARLNLLKLLLGTSNFLMMDEPTNHLDIPAREILEDALGEYEGTLFVISHDRYFLDRICTRVLELQPDTLTEYLGNYSDMLRKKAANEIPEFSDAEETINKTQAKAAKKMEREKERDVRAHKKRIQETEAQIAAIEADIENINANLCLEEVYSNPEKSREAHSLLATLQDRLNQTYQLWEELLGETE